MDSGSAPVLGLAFVASVGTSRRQEMKVGDLVKHKTTNKCYVITNIRGNRAGVWTDGQVRFFGAWWLEVINESR